MEKKVVLVVEFLFRIYIRSAFSESAPYPTFGSIVTTEPVMYVGSLYMYFPILRSICRRGNESIAVLLLYSPRRLASDH